MDKTTAGFSVVGGLVLAVTGVMFSSWASNQMGSPSQDWIWDVVGWMGIAGGLAGIVLFFWGARDFSRG
jgi:ABC-type enterobactin transport system permease subunit